MMLALTRRFTRTVYRGVRVRAAFGTLAALAVCCAVGSAQKGDWVPTWSTAPEVLSTPLSNQTIRMVVRTTLGGKQVRIRVSNLYGTEALSVGAAHVALPSHGAAIVPGTDRRLTFGGQPTITIPQGAYALSDPASLDVPELGDVAVTLYMPGAPTATTLHRTGLRTTYISPTGDFSDAAELPSGKTSLSYYWLTDVYVQADRHAAVIAAIGDSITDGTQSTPNSNGSWPSVLGKLLLTAPNHAQVAVVNQGISGNRMLHEYNGVNAVARFDRDVMDQPGITTAILLEGINDIGMSNNPKFRDQVVTADQIILGMKQLVERCHLRHIKIVGGTLTPFEGVPGYATPEGIKVREAVNQWIRTSGSFDAVIDFAKALDDPAHLGHLQPAFDSGDHIHPSDAGYRAMAAGAFEVLQKLGK